MPTKAFLDTTVLTDALTKLGPLNVAAKAALARYDEILLPGYAVKEFKAGPLRAWRWLHNKVVTTGDWGQTIEALSSVYPQANLNRTATKIVADFESSMGHRLLVAGEITSRQAAALKAKEARVWLKRKTLQAWRNALRPPYRATEPLDCYARLPPVETPAGLLDIKPTQCTLGDCCIERQLRADSAAAEALESVCKELKDKPEMNKRRKVLRHVRRLTHPITDAQCRQLGDAVFALQCPADAEILTTNLVDHIPLAAALGKRVVSP